MKSITGKKAFFALLAMLLLAVGVLPGKMGTRVLAAEKETSEIIGTPLNVTATAPASLEVKVTWSYVKNATGYVIYRKDTSASDSAYKKVGKTTKLYFTQKKLKNGHTYKYKVVAFYKAKSGKVYYGKDSAAAKITASKFQINKVHTRWFHGTMRYTTTVKRKSDGKSITVSGGTSVTVCTPIRTSGTVTIILPSGTSATTQGSKISYGNLAVTGKRYTTEQKENYVNSKGLSSATSILVWVDQYTCTTTVFRGSKKKWKAIRSMNCCVGVGGATGYGMRRITSKTTNLYGSYGLVFGGNAFHRLMDSNTRGAVSHGCVRLGRSDLIWMYQHVPMWSAVWLT